MGGIDSACSDLVAQQQQEQYLQTVEREVRTPLPLIRMLLAKAPSLLLIPHPYQRIIVILVFLLRLLLPPMIIILILIIINSILILILLLSAITITTINIILIILIILTCHHHHDQHRHVQSTSSDLILVDFPLVSTNLFTIAKINAAACGGCRLGT